MEMETMQPPISPSSDKPPLSVHHGPPSPHFNRNPKAARQFSEAHRSRLYEGLVSADLGIRLEELELHFVGMPLRYWPRVDAATLRWHLDIVHEFINGIAGSDVILAPPVVRWRHLPDRGFTEVVVCAWDRIGLLAKIAGSFAAVGLNIVRADIYTRADNVVLDIFQICDEEFRHVQDVSRLKRMEHLLTVALGPNAIGESALRTWMQHAGKPSAASHSSGAKTPMVMIDNERSDDYTVLEILAADRIGLLHDVLEAVSAGDVDIAHAIIVTEEAEAADVFFLTGTDGKKICDTKRLKQIRESVLAALG
jgi:[protein-PII] uridylyltransferase